MAIGGAAWRGGGVRVAMGVSPQGRERVATEARDRSVGSVGACRPCPQKTEGARTKSSLLGREKTGVVVG